MMGASPEEEEGALQKLQAVSKSVYDFVFQPISISLPCAIGWWIVGSFITTGAIAVSLFTIQFGDPRVQTTVVATTEDVRNAQKVEEEAVLFREILADVQAAYVDPVDSERFFETGVRAMLGSLDPYTEFENNRDTQDLDIMTYGRYGGVGLTVGSDTKYDPVKGAIVSDDTRFLVVGALEGYAWDAGLRTGDHIVGIDDQPVKGKKLKEITEMLRGSPGSDVVVAFQRDGVKGDQSTVLHRKLVQIPNVPLARLIGDPKEANGYIMLKSFAETSGQEVKDAIKSLKQQAPNKKLNSVILDLRGNPGGLLTAAVDVAEAFLEPAAPVVSTLGRTAAAPSLAYSASKQGPLIPKDTKVIVLTSGSTASAAEIVAGAIQDHDRGIVVGEKTFGKGLVQQVAKLPFDTSLKLTVAKYYTPSGRCIQSSEYKAGGVGREAAVEAERGQGRDFKFGEGSRFSSRKIMDAERKTFLTDKKRVVRDGGGIEPDVFVPAEKLSELEIALLDQNFFLDFAGQWAAGHPGKLDKSGVPAVDDALYQEFVSFVEKRGGAVGTRFDAALDDLSEAFRESKLASLEGAIGDLKDKARKEIMSEFKADRDDIEKFLDDAFRARVEPDSSRIVRSLAYDKTLQAARDVAKDGKQYEELLAAGRQIGGPEGDVLDGAKQLAAKPAQPGAEPTAAAAPVGKRDISPTT
mmetsp:Transcript_12595/g.30858  ORF Transcript_12595/g.30858 Transcript_12595/m.30858 type:complete len:691 (-) Transcript_12595:350-2422(-)